MVPELQAATFPVAAFLGYWFIIGICPPWPWPWPWPPPRPPWPWPWPPPPPPWLILVGIVGALTTGWGFTAVLGGFDAITTRLDFVLTGAFALAGAVALRHIVAVAVGSRSTDLPPGGPGGPGGLQR
jgi:hypothetical protein